MEVDQSLKSGHVNYMNRPNYQIEGLYPPYYDGYNCYDYPDIYAPYPEYLEYVEYPDENYFNPQEADIVNSQNEMQNQVANQNQPAIQHQASNQEINDNSLHADDLNFRERAEDGHST